MKTRAYAWTKPAAPWIPSELVYVVRRADLVGWYVVQYDDGGRVLMHGGALR